MCVTGITLGKMELVHEFSGCNETANKRRKKKEPLMWERKCVLCVQHTLNSIKH